MRISVIIFSVISAIIFFQPASAVRPGGSQHLRETIIVHDTIYVDSARLVSKTRDVEEILEEIPYQAPSKISMALLSAPRVFKGYRHLSPSPIKRQIPNAWAFAKPYKEPADTLSPAVETADRVLPEILPDSLVSALPEILPEKEREDEPIEVADIFSSLTMPQWLVEGMRTTRLREDVIYETMVKNPLLIEYAFWQLPEPPKPYVEDTSFAGYIRNQWLPKPSDKIAGGLMETEKINWIHNLNGGIQFSQAFISPNWYQGGNNSLSLLINFYWHLNLNPIFHPNLLLDNVVSYKLGFTSSPQDIYHKYTISEDLFQWNFKAGVKAFEKWFYSFTAQFKTQILHNYEQNSLTRTAAFLSPGDFNAGIGMTYSLINAKKTLKFNASIAPVSYNLKTCIDRMIDPTQFNIPAGKRILNEIGSSSELTLDWTLHKNVNYRTRLFLFTDYSYFQGDWENTLSFQFNRFLATQVQWHVRYDSSSADARGWHHWMLKEVLSFGISYTFSTSEG